MKKNHFQQKLLLWPQVPFKKDVSDEVDFLHVDKHESFPQSDTMIFDGGRSSIHKVPEVTSLQCLYNISENKLQMKLIFACRETSKFPTSRYYHY